MNGPAPSWRNRLGVTSRTVRRDVDRLRGLGYPVHSTTGTAGGYRLGAGAQLPPLLLDDEEAVAVAVGLRNAASGGVQGIEESSVRALAKLEQVLPHRLRRRVSALNAYTVPMTRAHRGPAVEASAITELAHACRDHQQLRFAYESHDGSRNPPHRRAPPSGQLVPPLVPGGLGRGPGGLAYVPRRPHHAHAPARAPLLAAHTAGGGPGRVGLRGRGRPGVRRTRHGAAAGADGAGRRGRLALGGHAGGGGRAQLSAAHRRTRARRAASPTS